MRAKLNLLISCGASHRILKTMLMAMGYVKKEVADQLGLSYRAVALYTENIYKKLQIPNIAAAVAATYRRNLI